MEPEPIGARTRPGRLTLVYGARDREHNRAVVIAAVIARRFATSADDRGPRPS